MAKLTLNGEVFDFDFAHRPMSEALALEAEYGAPYGLWERDLAEGSARAMCALIWLVWRRNGKDIALKDILSGEVDIDLGPLLDDLKALASDEGGDEAVPTPGPGTGQGQDGAPTKPGVTSRSSRKSSTSARGR